MCQSLFYARTADWNTDSLKGGRWVYARTSGDKSLTRRKLLTNVRLENIIKNLKYDSWKWLVDVSMFYSRRWKKVCIILGIQKAQNPPGQEWGMLTRNLTPLSFIVRDANRLFPFARDFFWFYLMETNMNICAPIVRHPSEWSWIGTPSRYLW